MKSRQVTTMEDPAPYHVGPTDSAEPPLTIDDLVAVAHANRQGIPYETGEHWLERLPERLAPWPITSSAARPLPAM